MGQSRQILELIFQQKLYDHGRLPEEGKIGQSRLEEEPYQKIFRAEFLRSDSHDKTEHERFEQDKNHPVWRHSLSVGTITK